ncbi:MAG: hypothetical protein HN578_02745 [Rhodospirillales bacterium]|jgi:hypothetical protein|nr:hypothetical protein [Rhodospirillales bacterium]
MGDVVTIGTKKAEFVSGVGNLFNDAIEGEVTGVLVVALTRDGDVLRMRGGNWKDDTFALIGGLEGIKFWLLDEMAKEAGNK